MKNRIKTVAEETSVRYIVKPEGEGFVVWDTKTNTKLYEWCEPTEDKEACLGTINWDRVNFENINPY